MLPSRTIAQARQRCPLSLPVSPLPLRPTLTQAASLRFGARPFPTVRAGPRRNHSRQGSHFAGCPFTGRMGWRGERPAGVEAGRPPLSRGAATRRGAPRRHLPKARGPQAQPQHSPPAATRKQRSAQSLKPPSEAAQTVQRGCGQPRPTARVEHNVQQGPHCSTSSSKSMTTPPGGSGAVITSQGVGRGA